MERVYYRNLKTKQISVLGTTERWPDVGNVPMAEGRFFTSGEVERRRNVVVLGQTAVQALFPNQDAVGKIVRLGIAEYEVVGVADKRPSPGGFDFGIDDFVVRIYFFGNFVTGNRTADAAGYTADYAADRRSDARNC